MNDLRMKTEFLIGDAEDITLTVLSPLREQRSAATELRAKAIKMKDDDFSDRQLEDEMEGLVMPLVHSIQRDGGKPVSGADAQDAARELGYLRGGEGRFIFFEVYFQNRAKVSAKAAGGLGGDSEG